MILQEAGGIVETPYGGALDAPLAPPTPVAWMGYANPTLARMRGPMHTYGPDKTPLFVTYHPAYLLRSPREKAKSWEDLKKISRFLKERT